MAEDSLVNHFEGMANRFRESAGKFKAMVEDAEKKYAEIAEEAVKIIAEEGQKFAEQYKDSPEDPKDPQEKMLKGLLMAALGASTVFGSALKDGKINLSDCIKITINKKPEDSEKEPEKSSEEPKNSNVPDVCKVEPREDKDCDCDVDLLVEEVKNCKEVVHHGFDDNVESAATALAGKYSIDPCIGVTKFYKEVPWSADDFGEDYIVDKDVGLPKDIEPEDCDEDVYLSDGYYTDPEDFTDEDCEPANIGED